MHGTGEGQKPDDDQDRVRIPEEAAVWFATMHGGEASDADQKALEAWLSQDARHAEAYADLDRLWRGSAELPGLRRRPQSAKRSISRRQFGAALILAATGFGAWRFLAGHPFADYRTATGERRTITLTDGSTVDLATETRLSVVFTPQQRLVALYGGEAFFTVTADAARPFVVEAGAGRTTALGTAFGVALESDGARVTVTEHAVEVALGQETARLSEGSSVTYDSRQIGVAEQSDGASLAWRDGRLVFTQAPLGEAVTALNRWRTGRLVIMSRALAARPITMIVNIDRTEAIASQLERVLPLRAVDVTRYLTLLFPAG
jgi:transmembrane sensor